ncbi:hypothetical protein E2C01_045491 [Portunus trituberculatus]|uniref:Uncharacterized protein n=1 Tax=Portunus trituberculatus TaxID=210409 RepID=A0A5B7FV47_PORTR|nr:hypothetical protein [Portunus trituberculatus]
MPPITIPLPAPISRYLYPSVTITHIPLHCAITPSHGAHWGSLGRSLRVCVAICVLLAPPTLPRRVGTFGACGDGRRGGTPLHCTAGKRYWRQFGSRSYNSEWILDANERLGHKGKELSDGETGSD